MRKFAISILISLAFIGTPIVTCAEQLTSVATEVHWQRWSDQVVNQAKSEQRQMLVFVKAAWCS